MKSLDGFTRQDRIPRRPVRKDEAPAARAAASKAPAHARRSVPQAAHGHTQQSLNDHSIDMGTLAPDLDIDEQLPRRRTRRRFFLFGRRIEKKPWSKRKKIIVTILLVLLLAALGIGGYFAKTLFQSTGQIFQGNPLQAVFSNKPLKTDQYGRSNILVFGTSEDDPGHPGADLTDSIMVISVDQKKHDAFLMSVPRDLWVKYGKACPSGFEGKINAMYLCGKGNDDDEKAGQAALQRKVGEVFDMDLQYVVHVNYKVLQDSVNALGGIDIVIESSDPRGIYDRNFDWRCKYKCNLVKYPNGPVHLDGEHALFLAQARNDAGGYGLPRGNFDREANQRKILIAAKDKASSVGFLANPVKVIKLIESLGNNVRSNFEVAEIKTLVDIAKNTPSASISSVSLIDQQPSLLTTGSGPTGSSIVKPTAGIYSFGALQSFTKAYLSGSANLLKEDAKVDVLNGSDTPGLAQIKADALAKEGIVIGKIANAPKGAYSGLKLYDVSKGAKPATKAKLEKALGVTATTEPLPSTIKSDASFVVIVSAGN